MASEFQGCKFQDVLDAYGMFVLMRNFLTLCYDHMIKYTKGEFIQSVALLLKSAEVNSEQLLKDLFLSWTSNVLYLDDVYTLFKTGACSSNRHHPTLLLNLSIHLCGPSSDNAVAKNFFHPTIKGAYAVQDGYKVKEKTSKLSLCCENFLNNISINSKAYRGLLSNEDKKKILESGVMVTIILAAVVVIK